MTSSGFDSFVYTLWPSCLGRTNQWYEEAIYCRKTCSKFWRNLKSILLHYTKIPTKQLTRDTFLEDEFSKSKQRKSTKWQKVGTKRRVRDLEQLCTKQEPDFLPGLLSRIHFVGNSTPRSSLHFFGLQHINSLACLNCTLAESHKPFCWDGPQRQPLVSYTELFIYVFGTSLYQQWGQLFLSTKFICCNDQLILQAHELLETVSPIVIIWTRRKSLLLSFLNTLSLTSNRWNPFWINFVLTFSKIHIVGTSKLV